MTGQIVMITNVRINIPITSILIVSSANTENKPVNKRIDEKMIRGTI